MAPVAAPAAASSAETVVLFETSIEGGATAADLTVQQQAFLLVIAAHGGAGVPLGVIRAELDMDQATASELLARLVAASLVEREKATERRALLISFTRKGRQRFLRSVGGIRDAIQEAERAGHLRALRSSLEAYLDHYMAAARARRRRRAQR